MIAVIAALLIALGLAGYEAFYWRLQAEKPQDELWDLRAANVGLEKQLAEIESAILGEDTPTPEIPEWVNPPKLVEAERPSSVVPFQRKQGEW